MRCVAVDLGDKRTGLAMGDSTLGVVQPIGTLEIPRGESLLIALVERLREYDAECVVLGLPLNMDETEGPRAKLVRDFGTALAERCALPLHYQDERLTSYAADGHMAQSGRTHGQKKKLRDALAAAEILRDFFEGGGP